jgi:putative intracellular protease/amidase
MRKIVIFASLIFVIGVFLFSSSTIVGPTEALGQSVRKVLMIPREGHSQDLDLMLKMEVGVMLLLLKNAGFEVDIATPSGPTSGLAILRPNQKIEKTLRLADINVNNYVGVIMPCMAVGAFPGPAVSPGAVAIVKKALADGKPVAASAWSTTILAEGGILKGKKYAAARDPLKTDENWKLTDLRYEGAIYDGPGVVQDGKIITSGVCPALERGYGMQGGVVQLTQTFIKAIGPK